MKVITIIMIMLNGVNIADVNVIIVNVIVINVHANQMIHLYQRKEMVLNHNKKGKNI